MNECTDVGDVPHTEKNFFAQKKNVSPSHNVTPNMNTPCSHLDAIQLQLNSYNLTESGFSDGRFHHYINCTLRFQTKCPFLNVITCQGFKHIVSDSSNETQKRIVELRRWLSSDLEANFPSNGFLFVFQQTIAVRNICVFSNPWKPKIYILCPECIYILLWPGWIYNNGMLFSLHYAFAYITYIKW